MTAYKFLKKGLKSQYDGSEWTVGKWRVEKKPTLPCEGLNASEYVQDALRYVRGPILAKVEYGGVVVDSDDKVTCEKMRVVETWPWTREMSVKLAVFAAEKVLPIFERKFPNDDRPRKAVEAIKSGVRGEALQAVTRAADAARAAVYVATYTGRVAADAAAAAYAAVYAADAAVRAGDAAADAAYAADAASAAYAADAAVYAAYAADAADAASAAYAAAAVMAAVNAGGESIKRAIHRYALELAKEIEE